MKLSVFSPTFIEAVRKFVEHELNYEYSFEKRAYVRRRNRSAHDLSQQELPYVTVTEILDFEDETYYGGSCDTCSYEEAHCQVMYQLDSGNVQRYEYGGSFSELIDSLVSCDELE